MQLYIVRHGQTIWNVEKRLQGQTDVPLDEEGERLARLTGRYFEQIDIDRCISSPLCRSLETARLILAGRRVPIETDPRIIEIAFGVEEGLSPVNGQYGYTREDFHYFFDDPPRYRAPEGGESFPQLLHRCSDFLDGLDKTSNETVLISTHGAAMRALLSVICHRPLSDFWHTGVPANCACAHIITIDGAWSQAGEERVYYEDI